MITRRRCQSDANFRLPYVPYTYPSYAISMRWVRPSRTFLPGREFTNRSSLPGVTAAQWSPPQTRVQHLAKAELLALSLPVDFLLDYMCMHMFVKMRVLRVLIRGAKKGQRKEPGAPEASFCYPPQVCSERETTKSGVAATWCFPTRR